MNKINTAEKIFNEYLKDSIVSIDPIAGGNINDTYLIAASSGKYVLQRLRKKMALSKLEYNFRLYSDLCDRKHILYPRWICRQDGSFFATDSEGQSWRMYDYIEGDILSAPLSDDQCYACGYGLGRLHSALSELPASPKAVYPVLHDLGYYYEHYIDILRGGDLCEDNRDASVEDKIRKKMSEISSGSSPDISVIHGDAKISNILFKNGEAAGFLDWDTIMTGSRAEEIADCIRSACLKDGKPDRSAAEALVNGYRDASGTGDELIKKIPAAFDKICFELALRYYTDAISKDKHFKEKYPGYRLKRAKELLELFYE